MTVKWYEPEENVSANVSPSGSFPYSKYQLLLNIALFNNSQHFFLQGTHLTTRNPIWMVSGVVSFALSWEWIAKPF